MGGLQPKTIDAYSRAIRRVGEHFNYQIDSLTEPQLTDFFSKLLVKGSWSTVKLDLYGLKFTYEHVLRKPWVAPGLIKPPKGQRLPDIITIDLAGRIFAATHTLAYAGGQAIATQKPWVPDYSETTRFSRCWLFPA